MNNTLKILIVAGLVLVIGLILLSISGLVTLFPVRATTPQVDTSEQAEIANPASAFCEEQGYTVEIRNDEQGNQYGVCIFTDGSECDEWAYFRGECSPGSGG
jgi:putative hemolysin